MHPAIALPFSLQRPLCPVASPTPIALKFNRLGRSHLSAFRALQALTNVYLFCANYVDIIPQPETEIENLSSRSKEIGLGERHPNCVWGSQTQIRVSNRSSCLQRSTRVSEPHPGRGSVGRWRSCDHKRTRARHRRDECKRPDVRRDQRSSIRASGSHRIPSMSLMSPLIAGAAS